MDRFKLFWKQPWGYKQSFIIAFAIMIIGFLTEVFSYAYVVKIPSWPLNFLILIVIVAYIIIVHFFFRNSFVKWLSSAPAAISSISILTLLILFMGFIPQERNSGFADLLGLTHIVKSWPYLFCSFFLLMVLGFTTIKKMNKFSVKNIAFFLNHGGLWLIIAAASLGSGDLEKYRMNLVQDRTIFIAEDYQGGQRQMPFALKLLDFNIDEYAPTLGLINPKTADFYLEKGDKLPEAKVGNKFMLGEWNVEVLDFIKAAKEIDTIYFENDTLGASPVAFIEAKHSKNGSFKKGWVTSGSFMMPPEFLPLDSLHSVVMTIPRPQRFSSDIRVFKKIKEYYDINLEVNKPKDIQGWKAYQTGYNEDLGRWSNLSIIELVKDPWLPAVYIGIFMVLIGSLYLVWMGKSKN